MSRRALLADDRRGLLLAFAGCAASATVLLLASAQAWLEVALPGRAPLPGVSQSLTGQEVVPWVAPIGILVGAAGLALIAARRHGRLVVASVLVAAGLWSVVTIGLFLYDGGVQAAADWAQDQSSALGELPIPARDLSAVPAVLALCGGGIAAAVGILATLRSRRWPVMGARYERRTRPVAGASANAPSTADPAARADVAPAASEAAMWAALERGEDPTATPSRPSPDQPSEVTRDQPLPGR